MKPFDLEAALNGAPVVTRDGAKVHELRRSDFLSSMYEEPTLCGIISAYHGIEFAEWQENGKYIDTEDSLTDLFMAGDE